MLDRLGRSVAGFGPGASSQDRLSLLIESMRGGCSFRWSPEAAPYPQTQSPFPPVVPLFRRGDKRSAGVGLEPAAIRRLLDCQAKLANSEPSLKQGNPSG